MKTLGIIPARYDSTRFPGKPLAMIGEKSMIQRVYERASGSILDEIIVATDDDRIYRHVMGFGGEAVMTSASHTSGTSRCAEVAEREGRDYKLIINIQGDEPFIDPELLNRLIDSFDIQNDDIATPVKVIKTSDELFSPAKVKVLIDKNHYAIYFSRSPLPFIRDLSQDQWVNNFNYYHHIGIYTFRRDVLMRIVELPQSALEKAESLEQLTWIYYGYRIRVMETDYESLSIDTPEDLVRANSMI
jgi:3-deoxy-manno-octulosonate cytidylyltransferase (CMP-KDO synthetase)